MQRQKIMKKTNIIFLLFIFIGSNLAIGQNKSFVERFYKNQQALSRHSNLICTKKNIFLQSLNKDSNKDGNIYIKISDKDESEFNFIESVLIDTTTISDNSYKNLFEKIKEKIIKSSSWRCGGDKNHKFYTTTRNNKSWIIEYSDYWDDIRLTCLKFNKEGNERCETLFKIVMEKNEKDNIAKKTLQYLNTFLDINGNVKTTFKNDSLSFTTKQYKDLINYIEQESEQSSKGENWQKFETSKNNLQLKLIKDFDSMYYYTIYIEYNNLNLTIFIEPNQPIEYRKIGNYYQTKIKNFIKLENIIFSEFYKKAQ